MFACSVMVMFGHMSNEELHYCTMWMTATIKFKITCHKTSMCPIYVSVSNISQGVGSISAWQEYKGVRTMR